MFALFGLSCTRFAVTICPALLKSLSWSTACWNGQISSGILRQERKIILMEFPPLGPSIVENCKYRAISLAARSRGDWAGDGECLIFLILVREPRFFLAFLVGGGWLLGSSTVSSGYYTKQ